MAFFFNAIDQLLSPFYVIDEQLFDIPAKGLFRVNNTFRKVLIMLDGDCMMTIDARTRVRFSTGDVFVFDRACVQDYSSIPAGKHCRLHVLRLVFDPLILPPLGTISPASTPAGDVTRDPAAFIRHYLAITEILPKGVTADIQECIANIRAESEGRLPGYRAVVSAFCIRLVTLIGRKQAQDYASPQGNEGRRPAQVIAMSKSYILANLSQPIRLREVAWHVGWSEEHFSRVFKAVIGQSPVHYIRQLRLDQAKSYLVGSNHTISEVAEKTGFSSLSVFSRCFQHSVGISPISYRQKERFGRVILKGTPKLLHRSG